ncbi:hypothetical protein DPEC_G00083770 [Dallia pectoralis]|uniref:Uncharacterized protein n=1 Tax=Dallia pectoralis TaxID=75939 RepID=A0ACC2GYW9_DALPE|nr:hypothetical protein DPEC_G00083770 [Dallia pectoralis]
MVFLWPAWTALNQTGIAFPTPDRTCPRYQVRPDRQQRFHLNEIFNEFDVWRPRGAACILPNVNKAVERGSPVRQQEPGLWDHLRASGIARTGIRLDTEGEGRRVGRNDQTRC